MDHWKVEYKGETIKRVENDESALTEGSCEA
ncbi:Uncharacterised protein [Bacillus freudenreichii]|nr:Uncharacterised protein [Bacillus freudenreichii]